MLTLEEIKAALEGQSITQVALATGLTRQTIHNLLSGRNRPSYAVLVKLSKHFEQGAAERG